MRIATNTGGARMPAIDQRQPSNRRRDGSNRRRVAFLGMITAILGAAVWLTPASGASTASALQQCAQGRRASYKLKPSDGAFLKRYVNCLLTAEGLDANPGDRVPLGYEKGEGKFARVMAPTVRGFAVAPRSDATLTYVNSKLEVVYDRLSEPFPRTWYSFWGDTTPPSPTLLEIASHVASARAWLATVTRTMLHGRAHKILATDVVVQKGVWFHDGTGTNLRYMVLVYVQQD